MPNWITDTLKAIGVSDIRNIILILDGIVILGLVYILVFRKLPEGNSEIMYMALGIILGVFATGRNYLFGQSKSENDKKKADDKTE